MKQDVLLACSTFPDIETARRIAEHLVAENLAACVNLIPAVESIYRWEGKIERTAEVIAFFKTTTNRLAAFQEKLKALHPYDVPELICLRIDNGLPEYLRWVNESCSPP